MTSTDKGSDGGPCPDPFSPVTVIVAVPYQVSSQFTVPVVPVPDMIPAAGGSISQTKEVAPVAPDVK